MFELISAAETWRRLKGDNQLPKIGQGVTFYTRGEVTNTRERHAV